MNTPQEIMLNYTAVAKGKTSQRWYKTLILAVLAGAFIALGGVVSNFASAGLDGGWKPLIKGAVFPVGLILVVVCGAELFTGNCLLIAPAVGKDIRVRSLFKNWGVVYGGNFIGGALIAILVVYSGVQTGATLDACIATAAAKCKMDFGEALLRGILCNILVCLAVWGAMASKKISGKVLMIFFPVLTFVACGFEHSIANMYYLVAGLLSGSAEGLNAGNALLYCLLPSTIGNVIGGALIALAYFFVYAKKKPVAKEMENKPQEDGENK